MKKESGKKFVENFNKAKQAYYTLKPGYLNPKITLKKLERLFSWAESRKIVPAEITNEKDAREANRQERLWNLLLNLSIKKWKVGDKYYLMAFPLPQFKKIKVEKGRIIK